MLGQGALEDGRKERARRRRMEPSCLFVHRQNDMHIYSSESDRGEGRNTKEPFIACKLSLNKPIVLK